MNRSNHHAASSPKILAVFLLLTTSFLTHCGEGLVPEQVAADTIFHNGHVISVNESFGIASAMAVKDGRFLAVGQDQDMLSLAGLPTD